MFYQHMIDEAIYFLRENEPPDGYKLAFSGGKDSVVIYHLARMAGVRFEPHYYVTTIDPPELMRFIHREYPDVKWDVPKRNFYSLMQTNGVPCVFTRWCCKLLKHCHKGNTIVGVRREESASRSDVQFIEEWNATKKNYNVIAEWPEDLVWKFIDGESLPVSSLYKEDGLDRLGCIPCPKAIEAKGIRYAFWRKRWPGRIAAFEKAFEKFWNRKYRVLDYGQALWLWQHNCGVSPEKVGTYYAASKNNILGRR